MTRQSSHEDGCVSANTVVSQTPPNFQADGRGRTMPVIYLAHEFQGDMCNLDRAERWCAFLCANIDAVFIAPWIPMCRHWPDSGATRARGMMLDIEAVKHCDGLVAVQSASRNNLSKGQQQEFDAAKSQHVISEMVIVYPDGNYAARELQLLRSWVASLGPCALEVEQT